jgi:nicotinamidase-related amidase
MEHAFGLGIPLTLAEVCHPHRTAVIVYDMQVGIVSQISDGPRVVACVASVLEAARRGGYRVFFTRHMSLPNEVAGVTQLRTAMEWQRIDKVEKVSPPFLREAPGFPIAPEIAPLPSEAVIDKITMSAFAGSWLDIALRDCGINSFVILGIALEVGIEPTVRHAMDLGYIPVIVTDACGYGNQEAAERSLAALKFTGGSLQRDSAALIEILGGTSQRAAAD